MSKFREILENVSIFSVPLDESFELTRLHTDVEHHFILSFMSNSLDLKAIESPLMSSSPSKIFIKTDTAEVKVELKLEDQQDSMSTLKNEQNLPGGIKLQRPRFTISDDSGRVSNDAV